MAALWSQDSHKLRNASNIGDYNFLSWEILVQTPRNTKKNWKRKKLNLFFSSRFYAQFLQELFSLPFNFKHGWSAINAMVCFTTKISEPLIVSPVIWLFYSSCNSFRHGLILDTRYSILITPCSMLHTQYSILTN